MRFVFTLAVMLTLHVSGIGFSNALLNAPLNDKINVNAPPGCSQTKDAVLDCVKDLNERVINPRRIAHGLKTFVNNWITASSSRTKS